MIADEAVATMRDQLVKEYAEMRNKKSPRKELQVFMDNRGCNAKQLELFAALLENMGQEFYNDGERFENSFNNFLPNLNLKQTF